MIYSVISSSEVDHNTQVAAHRALAAVRKELRLPMVNIKWFVDALLAEKSMYDVLENFDYPDRIRGLFMSKDPSTIYIHAMQLTEQIQETAIHETYHVWQKRSSCLLNEEYPDAYVADLMHRVLACCDNDDVYLEHMSGKDWSDPKPQKGNATVPSALSRNVLSDNSAPTYVQKSLHMPGHNGDGKKRTAGYVISRNN